MNYYPCWQLGWKRPDDESFPKVWHRFTVNSKCDEEYKIRIQDLTPDRHDEVWQMYREHFFADEDLHKAANEIADDVSMKSYRWFFDRCFEQRLSLIVVLDEDCPNPSLIGGLGLMVRKKTDPELPSLPGKARAKILNLMNKVQEGFNVFEKFNIDLCFDDFGLVVKPEYRRLSIGTELFKTIERMAKTFDIPVAAITFNNDASQAMAAKLGFTVLKETRLEDYKGEDGKKILPTAMSRAVKFTYLRYCSTL